MSIVQVFRAGGIVMIPLLLFSITAIALSIERIFFWSRISRRQRAAIDSFLQTYSADRSVARTQLEQHASLPIARIFLEALELEGEPPSQFRLALQGAAQAELPFLKRFGTVFQTIVAVSPLLGLLGTILGLIRSFATIRLGEVGANATAVTGGISEALVSTAAGMVVAIFTLVVANLFRGLYKRQVAMIEEYGSQLEILYGRYYFAMRGTQQPAEETYAR
ncbi:MotA/TolQ/ExbB proton channel family protein [Oscillatoria sp. CS-180]|uniref:MotA/TolQ/ExbB proton channel family protein n=1 Tax=Oscillatoria sp. CS-180 TaxID=3021720 RepID=UPI00232C8C22|nr:MotA/TolQ/ExbB proton channel family protein [Oscillatoria sp. CS-180]MDB9529351.1 MotA/TolQ/ExbB proton channel family protein [Oscillatoria sp. CS-180]